jgi:hypothetical protein
MMALLIYGIVAEIAGAICAIDTLPAVRVRVWIEGASYVMGCL